MNKRRGSDVGETQPIDRLPLWASPGGIAHRSQAGLSYRPGSAGSIQAGGRDSMNLLAHARKVCIHGKEEPCLTPCTTSS